MTQQKLTVLTETDVLAVQRDCEEELMDTLDELSALVTSAALPWEKRMRLFSGISHLRGHIACETEALEGEIKARTN